MPIWGGRVLVKNYPMFQHYSLAADIVQFELKVNTCRHITIIFGDSLPDPIPTSHAAPALSKVVGAGDLGNKV